MKNSSKRIKWIDIAKGVTILLVVLQHISTAYIRRSGNSLIINNNIFFKMIDLFDMPIFFFLSGLFIDHLFKRKFTTILFERFKRLMIPYFIWGVLSVIFLSIYEGNVQFVRIIELPIRPIFVLWFIYALFLIDIVLYIFAKVFKFKSVIFIMLLIMWIIGTLWLNSSNISVESFSRIILGVLQGSLFVYLGYIYKYYVHLNVMKGMSVYSFLSIFFMIVLVIFSYKHITSIIPIFIAQILGVLLVIYVSKLLTRSKICNFIFSSIGFLTMQIYVMHKFIVEILSILIFKITSNLFLFSFVNLLITIIICYIGIMIINKMNLSKWVFGTKK